MVVNSSHQIYQKERLRTRCFVVAASVAQIILLLGAPASALERRCGWLQNPTPGNWWLTDSSGTWELGVQGGYQAPGMDMMPDMTIKGWIKTNRDYGYGCACLDVETDLASGRILRLISARPQELKFCDSDKKLKRP